MTIPFSLSQQCFFVAYILFLSYQFLCDLSQRNAFKPLNHRNVYNPSCYFPALGWDGGRCIVGWQGASCCQECHFSSSLLLIWVVVECHAGWWYFVISLSTSALLRVSWNPAAPCCTFLLFAATAREAASSNACQESLPGECQLPWQASGPATSLTAAVPRRGGRAWIISPIVLELSPN